jgi:hypothetical protein
MALNAFSLEESELIFVADWTAATALATDSGRRSTTARKQPSCDEAEVNFPMASIIASVIDSFSG